MPFSRAKLGVHVLRLGLAAVFLWFGFSQLFDSLKWVSIVPDWAVNLIRLPPAMIVMGNGAFEVVLGSCIALGIFVRLSAFILSLHLIPIMLDFGATATAVRDFGIIIASTSLALIYGTENKPNPMPLPQSKNNFENS